MPNICGYQADEIFRSNRSLIYRGKREQNGPTVVLKTLRHPYPSSEDTAWFRKEFELTESLQIPGTVQAIEYQMYQDRPVMVLADAGDTGLDRLISEGPVETGTFLDLSLQIARILKDLHGRRLIHKDINPSNLILNSQTGNLTLVDFGIASELPREQAGIENPNLIEGTLHYISPEQSGRMNRMIDFRSDLYSLGVTCFELLTGTLPFDESDALGLVHAHLARHPRAPMELNDRVPEAVSNLVMGLLEKEPDSRYQSAALLVEDLEQCREEWQSHARVSVFDLRVSQVDDRFQVPQRLYGRESEAEGLLGAFGRVSEGDVEVVALSGSPGIGKTALVRELYRPVTEQRGLFASGKFDEYQAATPYEGIVEAFENLLRYILREDEETLGDYRRGLLDALGDSGKVLTDLLPSLELVIGPQPDPVQVLPTDAENRFRRLVTSFLSVFSSPGQPLVLFLDDVQWADPASLEVVRQFVSAAPLQGVLIILAYRDGEVDGAHPAGLLLSDIESHGTTLTRLTLGPITENDILALIQDSAPRPIEDVAGLASVSYQKTGGNPFFLGEFLASLHDRDMLFPAPSGDVWEWDRPTVEAERVTDNVVTLMSSRMDALDADSRETIKRAACIGSVFDLSTLASTCGESQEEVSRRVLVAVQEGMIDPVDQSYRLAGAVGVDLSELEIRYQFVHDRVRQAAYEMLTDEERRQTHRAIGYHLLHESGDRLEAELFEITTHLNEARQQNLDEERREELIGLNLRCGSLALGSAAYEAAHSYLFAAVDLTETLDWERRYQLTLNAYVGAARAAYLSQRYDEMDTLLDNVQQKSRSVDDRILAYEIDLLSRFSRNEPARAVEVAIEVLGLIDVRFPDTPTYDDVFADLHRSRGLLSGKTNEELLAREQMSDQHALIAMRVLATTAPIAYGAGLIEFYALFTIRMVELSLEHGNTPTAVPAFAHYALILCGFAGDLDEGHRVGLLALEMVDRQDAQAFKAGTVFIVNCFVRHWKEHIRETLTPLREAYEIGLNTGSLDFAALAAFDHSFQSYWMGEDLDELDRRLGVFGGQIADIQQMLVLNINQMYHQVVQNLLGKSGDPTRLTGDAFDEDERLPQIMASGNPNAICQAYLHKMVLSYLFGDFAAAAEHSTIAEEALVGVMSTPAVPAFHFYDSLLCLARAREGQTPTPLLERVEQNQQKLSAWGDSAPANYRHKYLLVKAERARWGGDAAEARELYDRAIDFARESGYQHEAALASELAAGFYFDRDQERVAAHYLRDAHYGYLKWGATAKAEQLSARHSLHLGGHRPTDSGDVGATIQAATESLDTASIIKASQALSGEILLENLLSSLMRITIENAGAEVGYLLLKDREEWKVHAQGNSTEAVVRLKDPASMEESELPVSVINYVVRTLESVVLKDAVADETYGDDPRIIDRSARSVLCAPIANQGNLIGLLYLENNLSSNVFTVDRVKILEIFTSQASISIENANLYEHQVRMSDAANRFVPHEVLRALDRASIVDVGLGDQVEREMSILVSDIRAFTSLSETMTPQECFDFINKYLSYVSPVITRHNGVIIKYMGDGIMAVFPGRVEDALNAAIDMIGQVGAFNQVQREQGQDPIRVGVGVHIGHTMLGTVGEPQRMQPDILSDAANLTDRLESLTKFYGVSVIVSGEAMDCVSNPGAFETRLLGHARVVGRAEPVRAYDLYAADEDREQKRSSLGAFDRGVSAYRGGDLAGAQKCFEEVLASATGDRASRMYLDRICDLLARGLPEGWDGVEQMEGK